MILCRKLSNEIKYFGWENVYYDASVLGQSNDTSYEVVVLEKQVQHTQFVIKGSTSAILITN